MRHYLWAAGLITIVAVAPAMGADLAVKAPYYKAPVVLLPTWTGWYVGGNAGWIGSADDNVTNTGTDTGPGGLGSVLAAGGIPTSVNVTQSGFLGGGQIGYNWQLGRVVYGLEADFDGSTAKSSTGAVFPGGAGFLPNTTSFSRDLDWLATVRGRLGYTVAPAFLVYGTGGLAVGQTSIGSSIAGPAWFPPTESESTTNLTSTNTSAGWTAGVGAEWLFAPRWSVKAEYLYVDLGTHSNTLTYTYSGDTSSLTSTVHDTSNIVRAGINYHF